MSDGFTASFGLLLKAARKRKKLTQRQLAERVGVHFNTLWAWERGDYLPATRGQVLELAQQLRLDAAETRSLLEASLTALSPHWTVPFPRNRCFSGRGILLKTLHTRLATDPSALQTRSVAVSGLGGIGKTQLVLEYAYRHALDYSAVFWLGADTAEALLAGLHQIASVLALPEGQEADQSHLVDAVRRWLSAHRGWLLIADNVEELALLEPVLPPARAGALLLTSRLQASAGLAERLDVPPLSQEEGVALLFQRAGRARLLAEEAAAGELVTLLGGLPLALDQAGAYLEETGCSVVEYLERYAQHRHLLLGRRGTSMGAHPDSVASTVRLAVEQVESTHPAAVDLLRLCAFLQSDAIPQEMLRLGAPFLGQVLGPVVADAAELDLALVALRRTSLISRQPETQTLTLHRLVQVVLQDSFDQASRRLWSERVVQGCFPT